MDQEGPPPARHERLWAFFELFALVGFVVAQPTLDVLGKAPDFFLFRRPAGPRSCSWSWP